MNTETDEIVRTEEAGGAESGTTEIEAAGGTEQNGNGPEDSAASAVDGNAAAELRAALSRAEERVTQLERERALLSQGVPEEDLDYYMFKIGKLVTGEKDFNTAAKEFLKQQFKIGKLVTGEKDFNTAAKEFLKQHGTAHRAPALRSTGASLAGRASGPRSTNDTMNRILRGV